MIICKRPIRGRWAGFILADQTGGGIFSTREGMPSIFNWVFQTGLFSTLGALRALVSYRLWRGNPPEAGKSKPPAVRVVVDFQMIHEPVFKP